MAENIEAKDSGILEQLEVRITETRARLESYRRNSEVGILTIDQVQERLNYLEVFRAGLMVGLGQAEPTFEYDSMVSFVGRQTITFGKSGTNLGSNMPPIEDTLPSGCKLTPREIAFLEAERQASIDEGRGGLPR